MSETAVAENIPVGDTEFKRQYVGIGQHGEDDPGKQQAGWDDFGSEPKPRHRGTAAWVIMVGIAFIHGKSWEYSSRSAAANLC